MLGVAGGRSRVGMAGVMAWSKLYTDNTSGTLWVYPVVVPMLLIWRLYEILQHFTGGLFVRVEAKVGL